MDKTEARRIVMDATRKAMAIFRVKNPAPARPTQAWFDNQCAFINAYVAENVPEETRLAAV